MKKNIHTCYRQKRTAITNEQFDTMLNLLISINQQPHTAHIMEKRLTKLFDNKRSS